MPDPTFVTDDLARWGTGTGLAHTAHGADVIVWDLSERVRDLEDNPVSGPYPVSITAEPGFSFSMGLSNGITLGPIMFAMPVPAFRGDWQPATHYDDLNFFIAPDGALGAVMVEHTSDTVFDWLATDGTTDEVLLYRNISGSGTGTLAGLGDVLLTLPTEGDSLVFDGTRWVNAAAVGGGGTLDGLSDVIISYSDLEIGHGIVWDGYDFVNAPVVKGPTAATTDNVALFSDNTEIYDSGYSINDLKQEIFWFAIGDETTNITTGTSKLTFRMPCWLFVQDVRASLSTESSSGVVTVDLNVSGGTALSTKLTIDATERTSTTAVTPAVLAFASFPDDAEITIDIDTAGTGAKGLKIMLRGIRLS